MNEVAVCRNFFLLYLCGIIKTELVPAYLIYMYNCKHLAGAGNNLYKCFRNELS